jgi:hypothetical protein
MAILQRENVRFLENFATHLDFFRDPQVENHCYRPPPHGQFRATDAGVWQESRDQMFSTGHTTCTFCGWPSLHTANGYPFLVHGRGKEKDHRYTSALPFLGQQLKELLSTSWRINNQPTMLVDKISFTRFERFFFWSCQFRPPYLSFRARVLIIFLKVLFSGDFSEVEDYVSVIH